ncbi:MAG: cytochrome c oxidase assembly protein [Burkholderiaceae bacterium]|jgi:cytochrome c oxidase assembly protein subunit 11|nr:cytochrome c oxidase assembly protein [Gemmatimonadales bacterium]MCO5119359.1 cytochrome c oxidase assembly protein [Burkholderiaceae bacterium]MEB2320362.1 cytochrome c oxidase assembly protein [Pseudomonadota bacterium]
MSDTGKQPARSAPGRANIRSMWRLLVVAVAMFGFGFALIPLYDVFCEITGINLLTKKDESAARFARNTQVDTSRSVVIEFDTNDRGALRFRPVRRSMEVRPGELTTIEYELVNTRAEKTAGQAIPSYAPQVSGRYFRKVECFCFEQQTMAPGEVRRFPVVFVVDPALPKDVNTITLSYTFFEVEGVGGTGNAGAAATPSAEQVRG